MTETTASVIQLDHYRHHRIPIRERRYRVEPLPRLGRPADVEINRVTEDCDHPIVIVGNDGDTYVRATCIVCGHAIVFPQSWMRTA